MIKFNIIGAGRLGKTMARLISELPYYELKTICNRTLESGHRACDDIGAGEAIERVEGLPKVDLCLITTNDQAIPNIVSQLSKSDDLSDCVVVHFSGVLSSDVLRPLRRKGASIASCHPMRSFSNASISNEQFRGTQCAIEGDEEAKRVVSAFLEELGAESFLIDKAHKASYHAAGVFASNGLIALADAAEKSLQKAGVYESLRQKAIVSSLMAGTLTNYQQSESTKEALTGPVARGDLKTIEQHLEAFLDDREGLSELYKTLSSFLLENVASLPREKQQDLAMLLQQAGSKGSNQGQRAETASLAPLGLNATS
jgi:predicted short-subunit dehydrogenase-like oxidoreductase (DUF2520 family)